MSDSSAGGGARTGGAGLAVAVALIQVLGTWFFIAGSTGTPGYVLLAVSGLLLANRCKSPGGTIVLVAAATVAYLAPGYPSALIFVAPVVAALNGLRTGNRGLVWAAALFSIIAWGLLTGATAGKVPTDIAVLIGVAVLVELAMAAFRALAHAEQEQWRSGDERRRRKASEERLLMAAELHDVLGHHLSLINVRAAVGRRLLDRHPEEARSALDAIEQASAEALREVRSVLDVLYPAEQAPPRAPTPGLAQLEELTGDAGLPVSTAILGGPRPLPAEVDRAAYRIVQEALTNVRRHARSGATASVLIDYGEREMLTVQIDDDGGAVHDSGTGHDSGTIYASSTVHDSGEVHDAVPPDSRGGNGITGMRERAAALGGSVSAHPRPGAGWRVRALFPLPGDGGPEPQDAR